MRAAFLDKDGTLVENVPFNVDPEQVAKPRPWDMKELTRFIVFIGPCIAKKVESLDCEIPVNRESRPRGGLHHRRCPHPARTAAAKPATDPRTASDASPGTTIERRGRGAPTTRRPFMEACPSPQKALQWIS